MPDDAAFCPSCGAAVVQQAPGQSPGAGQTPSPAPLTGLDALSKDRRAQDYWLRRLVGFVIDAVVVGLAVVVLSAIFAMPFIFSQIALGHIFEPIGFLGFGFASLLGGLIFLLYFTVCDNLYQGTLGKGLMGLRVTTTEGRAPDLAQAFLRNVSKIFWAFLLLDVVFGLATQTDYRQKFSDKYAKTIVVTK